MGRAATGAVTMTGEFLCFFLFFISTNADVCHPPLPTTHWWTAARMTTQQCRAAAVATMTMTRVGNHNKDEDEDGATRMRMVTNDNNQQHRTAMTTSGSGMMTSGNEGRDMKMSRVGQ